MVFAFQLNFPQSPEDQIFPECELDPHERCLLALCFFPFKTDICLPFDILQKFYPSVAGTEVNRNTESGQYLILRHLKFLRVSLQSSFLDPNTTLPDSLSLVWEWSNLSPKPHLNKDFTFIILDDIYHFPQASKNLQGRKEVVFWLLIRVKCLGLRVCDVTLYPFSFFYLVIGSGFYSRQWCPPAKILHFSVSLTTSEPKQ